MSNRVIGSCLLAAAVVLLGAPSASAQDTTTVGTSYDLFYREFEETSAVGAHVDIAVPVSSFKGVGEIGFNHFDGATILSFMGGGRWALPHNSTSRFEPGVQVLVGIWRCGACDENEFAFQPGFVGDYAYSESTKIRFQLDLRHIMISDFDDENAIRASVGLVWTLK